MKDKKKALQKSISSGVKFLLPCMLRDEFVDDFSTAFAKWQTWLCWLAALSQ
jgi:hypothetical protein